MELAPSLDPRLDQQHSDASKLPSQRNRALALNIQEFKIYLETKVGPTAGACFNLSRDSHQCQDFAPQSTFYDLQLYNQRKCNKLQIRLS